MTLINGISRSFNGKLLNRLNMKRLHIKFKILPMVCIKATYNLQIKKTFFLRIGSTEYISHTFENLK